MDPFSILTDGSSPIIKIPRFCQRFGARLAVAAICLAALLVAGCASNKYQYGLNSRFSMNVTPPPAWFADPEAELAPAEKEVLSRRGAPDFIRFWWTPEGALMTSSDFAGRADQFKDLLNNSRKSWIYLKDDEEVLFIKGGAAYTKKPLSEPIKLLCKYGDPSGRSTPPRSDGTRRETWQWIEHGLMVEIVDGKVVAEQNFPATGTGTYLLK